jgi:hypothetical protein
LIDSGASVGAKTNFGDDVIQVASRAGHKYLADRIKQLASEARLAIVQAHRESNDLEEISRTMFNK